MTMTIDLQALAQALAPIAEVGQQEISFNVGATPVVLRVLIPSEELAVQRYSSSILPTDPDASEDKQMVQEYLDRFRTEVLSTALVEAGGIDFRGLTLVPTGEVLDNGKPVQVPKVLAVRGLIGQWTRPVLDSMFRKYGELLDKVEVKVSAAIKFDPTDINTEIARLEDRLVALKEEKDRREKKTRSMFSNMVGMATQDSKDAKEEREEGLETLRVSRPEPKAAPSSSKMEVTAEPDEDDPPMDEEVFGGPVRPSRTPRQPPPGAAPRIDQPGAPTPPAEKATVSKSPSGRVDLLPDIRDSRVDSDDSQAMLTAAEEEHFRILERRRRAAAGQPVPSSSVLGMIPGRPQPPHLDAVRVESETQVVQRGAQVAEVTARAEAIGHINGIETFRMPSQDLASVPTGGPQPVAPALADTRNPRFRPPTR